MKIRNKNPVFIFLIAAGFLFFSQQAIACSGQVGSKEGQCAPDFTLTSLDGKKFSLKDLRGKVVLVNFWATWCKPCIVEMPSMQKLYSTLPKDKIEILAISIDSNPKEVQTFLDNKIQDQLRFPIFFDQGKKIASTYGTFQVPETYIIDPTGKVTDKVLGIREWDDSITVHYLELLHRLSKK